VWAYTISAGFQRWNPSETDTCGAYPSLQRCNLHQVSQSFQQITEYHNVLFSKSLNISVQFSNSLSITMCSSANRWAHWNSTVRSYHDSQEERAHNVSQLHVLFLSTMASSVNTQYSKQLWPNNANGPHPTQNFVQWCMHHEHTLGRSPNLVLQLWSDQKWSLSSFYVLAFAGSLVQWWKARASFIHVWVGYDCVVSWELHIVLTQDLAVGLRRCAVPIAPGW
jgi:hypothetical protein